MMTLDEAMEKVAQFAGCRLEEFRAMLEYHGATPAEIEREVEIQRLDLARQMAEIRRALEHDAPSGAVN